jgi:NAD(P)-dependent dehydrogenase (short-subunit alcohol dehydrogenase family)
MTTTLITGANRGLGFETARRLIVEGHTVYAGMRDLAAGDAVRALGAQAVQLDVTDDASVTAALASLPELDVLINSAGIPGPFGAIEQLSADDLRSTFEVNVFGIVRVTTAALPLLAGSANPVIVNVASGLGWPRFIADENRVENGVLAVPYTSSKAAVITMTLQYARNLPGMRINVIDPGYTATEFNGYSGHQTVEEGTDAIVAMATLDASGPTGTFSDRDGQIAW